MQHLTIKTLIASFGLGTRGRISTTSWLYYKKEVFFGKIVQIPNIKVELQERLVKFKDEIESKLTLNIDVDLLNCNFENRYFQKFIAIIDVFIFDRGLSHNEKASFTVKP